MILLFIGLALAYTRPLATGASGHVLLATGGDTLFNIYVISWTAHAMRYNPLGLFDTTMFYPSRDTLAFSDHEFTSALIAMPVLALTGNGVLGFNFVLFLSFIISALGAFVLVRHLTGDWLAAFAAGAVFGFPLYKIGHLNQIQLLSTGLIPLALLFLHLLEERRKARYALLFSICAVLLFWQVWSYGFYLAYATFVFLVVLAVLQRKRISAFARSRPWKSERRAILKWSVVVVAPCC